MAPRGAQREIVYAWSGRRRLRRKSSAVSFTRSATCALRKCKEAALTLSEQAGLARRVQQPGLATQLTRNRLLLGLEEN